MGFPHRCSRCKARRTLPRLFEHYARKPRCVVCNHKQWFLDKSRRRLSRQARCTCEGYWFPHRAGSACCNKNPYAIPNRMARDKAYPSEVEEARFNIWLDLIERPAGDQPPF